MKKPTSQKNIILASQARLRGILGKNLDLLSYLIAKLESVQTDIDQSGKRIHIAELKKGISLLQEKIEKYQLSLNKNLERLKQWEETKKGVC